jgi:hypothetical protein
MERYPAEIDRVVEILETIWDWGYVPHMFWQPNFGEANGAVQSVTSAVAAGEYDDEIGAWASALADWAIRPPGEPDRRVYINLAPEMNGDWVPWGIPTSHTSPEQYVELWHRIGDIVMETGLRQDHVQWLWTVNNTSSEPVDLEECYPGDKYVDWAGITGYNWVNWGGWESPAATYDPLLDIVREITDRPIAISELGASADCADGHCPKKKNEWISAVYEYLLTRDVRMACWFDHWIEQDGTDWGVFDTEVGPDRFTHGATVYRVYDRYRDAIRRNDVLGSHPVDARRLTDSEFQGTLIDAPAKGEKHRVQEGSPQ